jgi:tripartite-type tricarboxylate transporter receptor subunit TctC
VLVNTSANLLAVAALACCFLPPAVVNRINRETNAILKQAAVNDQFQALGAEPGGGTPAEFQALIKREVKTGNRIRGCRRRARFAMRCATHPRVSRR